MDLNISILKMFRCMYNIVFAFSTFLYYQGTVSVTFALFDILHCVSTSVNSTEILKYLFVFNEAS